jgi:D-alanine--D-alanine ligase
MTDHDTRPLALPAPEAPRQRAVPCVAVIGGGANAEHDVSRASAASVVGALREHGADVVLLVVDRDGGWHLDGTGPVTAAGAVHALEGCDVAFPVLHGERGEDGSVAGLLTMIGVPFVGSPVRAGALAADKRVTKLVARAVGVDAAPGIVVAPDDRLDDLDARAADAGLVPPLVVKPTSGGSSNGVSRVTDLGQLPGAVRHARSEGETVLVESFVVGREVDIALWRDGSGTIRAGSTLEIEVARGAVFDRASKYDGSAEFTVPARIRADEHDALETAARALWDALGCDGIARFDFFVTEAGVVLNEVNTSPGFTERSQVPRMAAAVGVDYVELVASLVDAALLGRVVRQHETS